MRQPGNEFKIDPFKAIGTVEMPNPVLQGTFLKDHETSTNEIAFKTKQKGHLLIWLQRALHVTISYWVKNTN